MNKLAILFIIRIIVATNFIYPQGEMVLKGEVKNLRGKLIRDIEEDGKGNIWLITAKGGAKETDEGFLCQYTTKGEWLDFKENKEIYGQKFTELNPENNKIACHYKKGVYIFDGTSWKNFPDKTTTKECDIPRNEIIYRTVRESSNRIWLETSKGLLLCENNNYKRYLEDISFDEKWTYFSKGHIYSESGIYQFSDDKFVKIIDTDYQNFRFRGADNQSRNWYTLTSKEKGDRYFTVSYYTNSTWKEFDFDLPYGKYLRKPKLYFQPDSSVWITSGEFIGIMKNDVLEEMLVKDSNIKDYLEENGIAKSKKIFILDMLIDSKGNIWMTTGGLGPYLIITIFSDGEIEIFETPSKLSLFNLLFEDSQERIWIGSSFDGIYMYEYNEN